MRVIFNEFSGSKSFLNKTAVLLEQTNRFDQNVMQSIKKIKELCTLLKSFRMPHKKMADESYNYEENNRQTGSGGYHTDILGYIIKLNLARIESFEQSVQRYISYPFVN